LIIFIYLHFRDFSLNSEGPALSSHCYARRVVMCTLCRCFNGTN